MKPRLLVTGGSSSLGRHIINQALAEWHVTATFWTHRQSLPAPTGDEIGYQVVQLDVRDRAAVVRCLDSCRPDVIIHTAGSNRSPDFFTVITAGSRTIANQAARNQIRLVHLSSDIVFDGTKAPYVEADRPNPQHRYGQAKALAEEAVIASGADAAIVRTSLIYSLTGDDHASQMLSEAVASGTPLTLFTDEYRCPIWGDSLAAACLELASNSHIGPLHVAGAQRVNRWQLAERLFSTLSMPIPPHIGPGPTPPTLRAQRPQDCTLDISLAQRILNTPLPGLDQVFGKR